MSSERFLPFLLHSTKTLYTCLLFGCLWFLKYQPFIDYRGLNDQVNCLDFIVHDEESFKLDVCARRVCAISSKTKISRTMN